MLSRLIVSSYEKLIELSLWLFLIVCIAGGWLLGTQAGYAIVGAIGGAVVWFVVGVMFFGAFLILGDIRKLTKEIVDHKAAN